MVILVKFDDDTMRALLYSQHFLHYKSMGKIFIAQGQEHITPKPIVRTGPKSNSSKILDCLCYLQV